MHDYSATFAIKRLWLIFSVGLVVMFATLLFFGGEIYQRKPPIPAAVETTSGKTLFTRDDIRRGQNVWQSLGGMQQGSIWGHGSYLAPDWSADWLHREAEALLHIFATQDVESAGQAGDRSEQWQRHLVQREMRTNKFDPETELITVSNQRASAIREVAKHYKDLFQARTETALKLRIDYAFPRLSLLEDDEVHALTAFFFWTAWAAGTERPNDTITYTSNWPHEPLVGNTPTGAVFMWSIISVFLLLAGIGALVWYYARQFDVWRTDIEPEEGFATEDFISRARITPSMKATAKFFWVVCAMFVAQVILGIITAHYAVEGQDFYGFPLSDILSYSVTRTWHTQLAIFWIVTAWLAAGLYVAPLISGHEPKFQKIGVNFLFVSLLIIVVGSFGGEWMAINRFITDLTINFWFGHQGYEYIDLGRFWQLYLFVGLLLWVVLVLRSLWPALNQMQDKSLLYLVIFATVSIGLLYGAGLMWGQFTHISVMEYWRWWVVHLWVEGIFEVFATAIIALLFVRMGILRISVATTSVLLATIIFLGGGVLGTFHHLYWSGTPISVIALGGVFSALEVVPLIIVGFEAYNRVKIEKSEVWEEGYHWPFMFFGSVLIWNMVGAGLFGFLINPPLSLYYMQGLNTTAAHAHAALFGVYGMLGLGLILYCLRGLTDLANWNQKLIRISFWSLNIGLAMMVFMSLLPQGLWQTYMSFSENYAYARSPAVIHSPVMEALVWARVPGDIVFAVGVFAFAGFILQAFIGKRSVDESKVQKPI